MSEQVYKDMVEVMGKRRMEFAGKDIPEFYPMVEELFTPEEAAINNAMPQDTFTTAEMAEIMGTSEGEMAAKLKKMADKALCQSFLKGDLRLFRAAPLVPGILEFVFIPGGQTERDKRLAKLIYEYKEAYTADSPLVIPYPIQRVITVDETIASENKVHTYDLLDECSAAGLVHQTSNVTDKIGYLCNCDKWHCYSIKIFLQQTIPSAVFNSGFEPKFDPDKCTACETCIERCPAIALEMGDEDVPKVDLNRCFGCAVCATGCDDETISMVTKAGYERPPKDHNELMTAVFKSLSA